MTKSKISKSKGTILVIDDNAGILFVLRKALELKGYEVHTSDTYYGVEAVEKIASDLMYLDISLVGIDGREVCQELKSDTRTKHIPIIILTAYPNADELAKEAGANDFLPKPFDIEALWKMTVKHILVPAKNRTLAREQKREIGPILSPI